MADLASNEPNEDVTSEFRRETLSVAPPRNFFRTIFEITSQDSIDPITYGTDLNNVAQSKIEEAEAQIRKISKSANDCSPATVRISHLHQLMVHDPEGGHPVRDFLGMGTLMLATNPSGPKLAYTGDLFIRFVPRVPNDNPSPHVPYPDPHQVLQAHRVIVPPVTFNEEPFIDISHSHSFRRLPSSFEEIHLKEASHVGKKVASLTELLKNRARAVLGTNTQASQPLLREPGEEADSELTSSTDSEASSITDSDLDELDDDDFPREAPTIPRDNFIYPLPPVDDDLPPLYLSAELPALGDAQPRFDSFSSYEKHLAEEYPYRYFHSYPTDSTDSIPSAIAVQGDSDASESFFPAPVVTTDDGRTFVSMEVNPNDPNPGPFAPYTIAANQSLLPTPPEEEMHAEPNPFLDNDDPMEETRISLTTKNLLESATDPAAKNLLATAVVTQNPPQEEDLAIDMDLDSPTPAKVDNPFRDPTKTRFGPPLDPRAPRFQPGQPSSDEAIYRPPNPTPEPFPNNEPTAAPPQTFPVTAHFFSNVTNRLLTTENRTAKVEKDLRTCQEDHDKLRGRVDDDQKRMAELSFLFDRVKKTEEQQKEMKGKIFDIRRDGAGPANFRFKRDTNLRLQQTSSTLKGITNRINHKEEQVARDIGELKKTLNNLQVKSSVDKASSLKDIIDLRGTVYNEYKNRLATIESTLKLIFSQDPRSRRFATQNGVRRKFTPYLPTLPQTFVPSFISPVGPPLRA